MRLYIGKNHESGAAPVQSIFRLVGNDEDALTYALGFLLALDPDLCAKLVRRFGVSPSKQFKLDYSVYLQEVTGLGFGRRDIVIESTDMRLVIEAKIGNSEPTSEQILKYSSEKGLWQQYPTKAIVALTQVPLMKSTAEQVCLDLAKQDIDFSVCQWHQVLDVLLSHKSSGIRQYLLNEFIHYATKDYEMGYHDAEILIQDLNKLNADIYKEGWVYVTSPKDKKMPLYFAPYLSGENAEPGIQYMSRVLFVRNVKLSDGEPIPEPPSAECGKAWCKGLEDVQRRGEQEGFLDMESRVFYLDRPMLLTKVPLTKRAHNAKEPKKQIPQQIPKGFSMRFDELLSSL